MNFVGILVILCAPRRLRSKIISPEPLYFFRLPMERVMRLGPDESRARRMMRMISTTAMPTSVTPAMSKILGRAATSTGAMATSG